MEEKMAGHLSFVNPGKKSYIALIKSQRRFQEAEVCKLTGVTV